MLIPSDRHTPRDLEHWVRCEAADRIYGRLPALARKSARAVDAIRAFAEAGPCYLGTSWGKDSVVACHLAVLAGVRVPMVHIVQLGPHHDPYQELVRDAFLARFGDAVDYHEIIVEPLEREQRDGGRAPQMIEGIARAQRRWGERWIGGLRADESGQRKLSARRGSRSSCWPIAWWTAQDVFAWLAAHDLPVHPSYAMTGGGMWDRDHIRVSIIGGKKGTGHGRREWEWAYYPDVMRRLDAPVTAREDRA